MTADVTVVIPTRDRPELLEAAIESVLRQSCPVAQILVVDDASNAPGGLSKIAARSPAIEIVRRPVQGGPAAARNTGLDLARGDFLLFLDDDDLVHPRFVEDGLAALNLNPDADAVFFLYECLLERANLKKVRPGAAQSAPYKPGRAIRAVKAANPAPRAILEHRPATAFIRFLVPVNSCLIRRAAIGSARFPEPLRQGEDTYFWILLASRGRRFVLDDRVYAFVRRHQGNTTRSRIRYIGEIQACYEFLLEDGLLTDPDDVFLAHFKLLWFKCLTGRPGILRHLNHVLGSPSHLAREIGFWFGTMRPWRRLTDYRLSK